MDRKNKTDIPSDVESIVTNKNKFEALCNLFQSADKNHVDTGIELYIALNDKYLTDKLLDKIEFDNGLFLLNNFFKRSDSQLILNHTLLRILYHAPQESEKAEKLKASVNSLTIDLSDLKYMGAFPNLNELKLIHSKLNVTNLSGIENCKKLEKLDISNCTNISDISAISTLPIAEFIFTGCFSIESLEALCGKKDRTALKELNIQNFRSLKNLNGIEFYSDLTSLIIGANDNLSDASSLEKINTLKNISIQGSLLSIMDLKPLILKGTSYLDIIINSWDNNLVSEHPDVLVLKVNCHDMNDLEWLQGFPNLQSLKICLRESQSNISLESIEGLRFVPSLEKLNLYGDGAKTFKNLDIVGKLSKLKKLELQFCGEIINLDPLFNLNKKEIEEGNKGPDLQLNQNLVADDYKFPGEVISTSNEECFDNIWISIRDCKKLEDLSGWTNHIITPPGYKRIDASFVGFPSLKKIGYIHKLRNINFVNSFNNCLVDELRSQTYLESVLIQQDNINLHAGGELCNIEFILYAKNINLSGNALTNVSVNQLEAADLSNFKYLDNLHSLSIGSSYSSANVRLNSLNGISCCKKLSVLKIDKCETLSSIDDLRHCTELKSLTILSCPQLKDTSALLGLDKLEYLDLTKATHLNVKPRSYIMNTEKIIQYKIKLSEYLGLKPDTELINKKAVLKSKNKEGLRKKDIDKFIALLKSEDINQVETGIELVISINDEYLYDKLFEKVTVIDGYLNLYDFFKSYKSDFRSHLYYAFFRMVKAAAASFGKWQEFCQTVTRCGNYTIKQVSYDMFKNLSELTLGGFKKTEFQINANKVKSLTIESVELDCEHLGGCPETTDLELCGCFITNGSGLVSSMKKLRTFIFKKKESHYLIYSYNNNKSDTEIYNLVNQLKHCTVLESVLIEFNGKDAFSFNSFLYLNNLKNLVVKNLNPAILEVDSLQPLANCTALESLELKFNSTAILSTDYLHVLTSLKKIALNGTFYDSTIFLHKLKYLKTIILEDNRKIVEMTLPENMSELDFLRIKEMVNLKVIHEGIWPKKNFDLFFENLGIEKLTLDGIISLRELSVENCFSLTNLDFMQKIEHVSNFYKNFSSGCNSLKDISGISHFIGSSFEISGKKLPVIKDINNLRILEAVNLETLEGIHYYNGIEQLILTSSKISDLKPISTIESLNILKLNKCKNFIKLDGLEGLKKIKIIDLSESTIEDLTGFSALESLETLILENCLNIYNLNGLNGLKKLKVLNLKNSGISDLSVLSTIENLEVLNLENCKNLTNLNGMAGNRKLKELNLRNTENLTDVNEISGLLIQNIAIRGSKMKKADFPERLQDFIDWKTT